MKRCGNLLPALISDENIAFAIQEVNRRHRIGPHHKPNRVVKWVERTLPDRIEELRCILRGGFAPSPALRRTIYDTSCRKEREIYIPKLWPDQYVHHALIQVIQPIIMRGMDHWSCGSIPGRGPLFGKKGIERWMRNDKKGTRYCLQMDIRRFYPSLKPEVVMAQMARKIKDKRVLALIRETMKDGVPIGCYFSQWYANAALEPLDRLMREHGGAAHHVRYMDNLTVFGPNKRKLRRLVAAVKAWLEAHDLALKPDWQIFPTKDRTPDAMGFRFRGGVALPRKKNVLALKRSCIRVYRRIRNGMNVTPRQARVILSRVGSLSKARALSVIRKWVEPIGIRRLKAAVRYDDLWRRLCVA